MRLRRKLAVVGIFGLGALVTITGIIRLHFVLLEFAPLAVSGDSPSMFVPKSYDT